MRKLLTLLGLGLLVTAQAVHAQCRPAPESNEAKLLAFYSAPLTLSMDLSAVMLPFGALRVSGEIGPVPNPDPEIQQTGACFMSKSENSDLTPVFARPRIAFGLPWGFAVDASYLPPIKIADAEPHLGALGLSYVSAPIKKEPFIMNVIARTHTLFGYVKGPITCPDKSLQQSDATEPCYGSNPSEDRFRPNTYGGELALSIKRKDERVSAYLGGGINAVCPRFQVGFTDALGNVDNTKVEVNLTRAALFAGGVYKFNNGVDVSTQIYSVPEDVTTFRLGIGYTFQ